MATHTWNGHAIEVQSYATPRLLWFSVAFLVHVDGAASFRSPSHIEGFRTIVPFQILVAGAVRHGRVESTRPFSVLRGGYRVYVEDQEVASGTARAQNWYIAYGVIAGIVLASIGFSLLH
jgi:hypothetical protein